MTAALTEPELDARVKALMLARRAKIERGELSPLKAAEIDAAVEAAPPTPDPEPAMPAARTPWDKSVLRAAVEGGGSWEEVAARYNAGAGQDRTPKEVWTTAGYYKLARPGGHVTPKPAAPPRPPRLAVPAAGHVAAVGGAASPPPADATAALVTLLALDPADIRRVIAAASAWIGGAS